MKAVWLITLLASIVPLLVTAVLVMAWARPGAAARRNASGRAQEHDGYQALLDQTETGAEMGGGSADVHGETAWTLERLRYSASVAARELAFPVRK